jgi:hypothetical protein
MKWFSDSFAQDQHRRMAEHLKPLIVQLLGPTYELSHVGINKNEFTGEVILKLHLNPIGRIQVKSDPLKLQEFP